MTLDPVAILSRWLHVTSACLLVGSVFFFDVLLPLALRGSEPAEAEVVRLRSRRGFKMTVHVTLLLFLLSGTYNAIRAWPVYTKNPGVLHGLFGLHLLLGLGAVTLLMIMLAGREPKRSRSGWSRIALVLLLLGVAAASTLKSGREWTMAHGAPAAAVR